VNLPEQLKSKNVVELEEWFLEGLEREPIPASDMMAVLREVHNAGATSQAYSWAELLQDTLAEHEDRQHSLRLLEIRLGWCGETQGFRKTCHEAAAKALSDRLGTAFVKAAGFDDSLPIGECLRRLNLLLCLCPDRLCHDKTWGFGVIKRLDDFYEKVTIDFRKKSGHQMSFAYASETLELIDENHLQSQRHRDEAALQVLVADDAAEIVRIALQSYGPLSADVLKEILVDGIVAANGWKDFWDRARRGLKQDSLVAMPAKRSEAIHLLSSERSYDKKWFEALAEERDPQVILDRALELGESGKMDELSPESRDILRGRLRFVTWSMEKSAPRLSARAALLVERFGLREEEDDLDDVLTKLRKPKRLAATLHGLPVREVASFLEMLLRQDADLTRRQLAGAVGGMSVSVLNVVIETLRAKDAVDECARAIREQIAQREPPMPILYWLCRHLAEFDAWDLGARYDLLKHAFDGMQRSQSGDGLKAQNQLRLLIRQQEWLRDALSCVSEAQRRMLMAQLNSAQGWDPSERRSVMAAMIKLYPDLEQVVRGEQEKEEAAGASGRWTSVRSYAERREQLRRLVEVEIPENSREIGVARSYGDLRENAEYQAARDHQGILMRRKAEIEHDLKQVRATDFRGMRSDGAGMGTCVTLEREDGKKQVFNLLGEWDRDAELSIISSQSKLAQLLERKHEGDDVVLPGEDSDMPWRIARIEPISDEIEVWIKGESTQTLEVAGESR